MATQVSTAPTGIPQVAPTVVPNDAPEERREDAAGVAPGPIVVGVDAHGRSASAVVWAADEGEGTGRLLRLVTVLAGLPEPTEAHEISGLATLARKLTLAGVQYVAVAGDPTAVLLEEARGATLLVVGRRGLGHAERLVLGRTSLAVAARSAVPVVIVPERWMQPSMSSSPVVAGVTTTDPARDEQVLDFAVRRATRLRVPLVVVSAWELPLAYSWTPDDTDWAGLHEQALDELLRPWREQHPYLEIVARSTADSAPHALVQAAEVSQLVVVGQHKHALRLGSTTRELMHRVTRPVAVVPSRVTPAG